jgi:phosphate transport system protein
MNLRTQQSALHATWGFLTGLGFARLTENMSGLESELRSLKQQLLVMGSHAEAAVNRAVRAILRRDDDLARRTREDDTIIDRLELEIDHGVLALLGRAPESFQLRLLTAIMRIARELERVGDEATTISRRCIELGNEPPLKFQLALPKLAGLSLEMLKEALDAFVSGDSTRARTVIPRDDEVDRMHQDLHRELAARMAQKPEDITRCLQLMIIIKSLERIADHATNVAEIVVYLYEGRDIRHATAQK